MMLNVLPLLCRGCGKSSREVRFASKHECIECSGARKRDRADRIAARGPRLVSVREPDAGNCPSHLAWIRKMPCAVRGHDCRGPVHAHHVRENSGGGTSMKPSDAWAVPLCGEGHHAELHRIGAQSFAAKHDIDLRALAIRLASLSPHIKRGSTP